MPSTSSDESYTPERSRRKRYSKVTSRKRTVKIHNNTSSAAGSSFDASFPSCSGYQAGPSFQPATSSSSESESDSPLSTHSITDYSQLNCATTSLPASLGIKNKVVAPTERLKRWHMVADKNKKLLKKMKKNQFNALKDSPLLNGFRKRKSDPEFRRLLNRPSKAIKIFSDDEEEKQTPNASKGFPFNKEYDDYFRKLNICESDEELSKWLKDTKQKRKIKSSYKGGPLADEYLLPIDYKKILGSDSDHPQSDTGEKNAAKRMPPVKAKSSVKKSKSSLIRRPCPKKPKSAARKQSSMKSGKGNLPLSLRSFDEIFDDSISESESDEETTQNEEEFEKLVSSISSKLQSSGHLFPVNESSNSEHTSQSIICIEEETSEIVSIKETKSFVKTPRFTAKKVPAAKKQSSAKKYKSRESKSTRQCKKADSMPSQVISLLPLNDNVDVSSENESVMMMVDSEYSGESAHDLEDQRLKVVLPKLPIASLSSASGQVIKKDAKRRSAVKKGTNKYPDAKKIKIKLLSHEHIINDKIPRVSLVRIPLKLPYVDILSY